MATERQKKAAAVLAEKGGGSVGDAMRKAGYSKVSAATPKKLTQSKGWQELMDQYLPEKTLAQAHKKLLKSKYLDHMVFPLATPETEIRKLINSVGGTVRRFQHGDTALHVWFWADNTKAIKDAIEMAYKLRGRLKENVALDVRKLGDVLDELDTEEERAGLADEAERHLKGLNADGRSSAQE